MSESQERVNFSRSDSDYDSNEGQRLLPQRLQNAPSFSK